MRHTEAARVCTIIYVASPARASPRPAALCRGGACKGAPDALARSRERSCANARRHHDMQSIAGRKYDI
eukprot:2916892-Pleurochrysis_carterae.AAC.2